MVGQAAGKICFASRLANVTICYYQHCSLARHRGKTNFAGRLAL